MPRRVAITTVRHVIVLAENYREIPEENVRERAEKPPKGFASVLILKMTLDV